MSFLTKHKFFLLPFILWLLIGSIVLSLIQKGDLVLWFNDNRFIFGNFYFTVASAFAEWQFILFFLFIVAYEKIGNLFILALTWAFTGIVAQSLKRLFDMPRPAGFYKDLDVNLNFINDDRLYYANSFPSGHTTTAFALFFIMAIFTKNKYMQFLFFIFALSTAFSRVYLLQHFFMDVYFGSILGVLLAYLIYNVINKTELFGFQNWRNKKLGKAFF
ncbi:MAG: membrane-associated phospholipid phosphatase [Planctomycetota bacterium]|jgi:membrane-associated phospholipid phosphatase